MKKKRLLLKSNPSLNTLILVGLGNPGPAYLKTRHNVGFLCVDRFAEKQGVSMKKPLFKNYYVGEAKIEGWRIVLVKPLTFMNRSGQVMVGLMKKYRVAPDRVVVAVDNMDLPPGGCRLKLKGSSAGHNGLKSLMAHLETPEFMRLYIGVGRPDKGTSIVDHVLGTPKGDEWTATIDGVEKAAMAVHEIYRKGPSEAMNGINRKRT